MGRSILAIIFKTKIKSIFRSKIPNITQPRMWRELHILEEGLKKKIKSLKVY